MAWGPDLEENIHHIQEAVDAIMFWAEAHFLCLSPKKSEAMIFTRQRKYGSILESATQLVVAGKRINYEPETVRYLGIWLDRSLSWNHHIRIKISNVKKLLARIQSATGSLWGLKPYLGKYFWEALGRTVLAFGCLGWSPCLKKKGVRQRLCALQRQGLKLITFFRKSTPNKGLELAFNVPPLEIHLVKLAMRAFFRTSGLEPFTRDEMRTPVNSHTGHRNFITNIVEECNLIYQDCTVDLITPIRVWDKEYTVNLDSMNPENKDAGIPVLNAPGITVYTDGSQKEGRTGAWVVFYHGGTLIEVEGAKLTYSFRLRDQTSVFQSEVWALKKAAEILLENIYSNPPLGQVWVRAGRQIQFYSDSQSALKALSSSIVKSRVVKETMEMLDKLATVASSVTLNWVRGHDGHTGNINADTAADEGRTAYNVFSPDSPDPPLAALKLDCDKAATDFWKASWKFEEGKTCSQTRLWFPNGPRPDFAFDILRLPRVMCSQVLQFVTGHSFLNRHQALIDNAERDQIDGLLSLIDDYGEEVIPPLTPLAGSVDEGRRNLNTL